MLREIIVNSGTHKHLISFLRPVKCLGTTIGHLFRRRIKDHQYHKSRVLQERDIYGNLQNIIDTSGNKKECKRDRTHYQCWTNVVHHDIVHQNVQIAGQELLTGKKFDEERTAEQVRKTIHHDFFSLNLTNINIILRCEEENQYRKPKTT